MAAQYRITYFDSRGRAEASRMLLSYKSIPFEEIRTNYGEWPKIKPTSIWGTLPVLEDLNTNFKLGQSGAILRYLAKKYDLAGSSDEEFGRADDVAEAIGDLSQKIFMSFFEPDEVKKSELTKAILNEHMPNYLKKFEGILKLNGSSSSGFFIGKLSYADFHVASSLDIFLDFFPEMLDEYPMLKAHKEKIFNLPGVKEWVEKRPKTQY